MVLKRIAIDLARLVGVVLLCLCALLLKPAGWSALLQRGEVSRSGRRRRTTIVEDEDAPGTNRAMEAREGTSGSIRGWSSWTGQLRAIKRPYQIGCMFSLFIPRREMP